MSVKRVLSGMRPTGRMQLGNLLGAVENWKSLAQKYESFFFIADWHALTTNYEDTKELWATKRNLLVDLLASGLDFISAFSAVIACINNAGPGLGEVGPASNYAGLSDFQTWALALTMLLGRLELFTVFVLFPRAFWRG